jgi:hypothetical protein
LFVVLFILIVSPIAQACEPPQGAQRTERAGDAFELESLKWQKRIVVLLAPGPRDRSYAKQQEALTEHAKGLEERHIAIVSAFTDGTGMLDGRPIDQKSVRALRRDLNPARRVFTFVLIGKDGTEKMRVVGKPAEIEEVFATIDAMPMRQKEMKGQSESADGK